MAGASDVGTTRPGIGRTSFGFAAGSLLFAAATLAYTIHPLQPLPVSNSFVPAVVALSMLVMVRARPDRPEVIGPVMRLVRSVVLALVALAVVVPALIVVTWPSAPVTTAAGRPIQVMTFNIDEGIANGPLDLEEVARTIEAGQPDVVVIEELGRGWAVSGMTDEAEWLRRRLDMPYGWAPANDHQFGNIVLSRLPILDSKALTLPRRDATSSAAWCSSPSIPATGHRSTSSARTSRTVTHRRSRTPGPRRTATSSPSGTVSPAPCSSAISTPTREVPPGWPELDIPLDAGFHTPQDTDHCTMPTSNENCPDWIMASPDAGATRHGRGRSGRSPTDHRTVTFSP